MFCRLCLAALITMMSGGAPLLAQDVIPLSRQGEFMVQSLRADIASKQALIDANEADITANSAELARSARLSADFQSRIWPQLNRVESGRRLALENCYEILEVYAEKRANCIADTNARYDALRREIDNDLTATPLMMGPHRISSIAAYYGAMDQAQRLAPDLIVQSQRLMSENNRLRHEITETEERIRRIQAKPPPPPAGAFDDVTADGEPHFPTGGSLFDRPRPDSTPPTSSTSSGSVAFPVGGSISSAPPLTGAGQANRVVGAGATGFDSAPPRPTGPILPGFWRVPASGAIIHVYSMGGTYQGRVVAPGHSGFSKDEIIWRGIHRPAGQRHWSGNGIYTDDQGNFKRSDITLLLTSDQLILNDSGAVIALERTSRPR